MSDEPVKTCLGIIGSKDIELISAGSSRNLYKVAALRDTVTQRPDGTVTLIMSEYIIDLLKTVHIYDHGADGFPAGKCRDHAPGLVIESASVEHAGKSVGNAETLKLPDQLIDMVALLKSVYGKPQGVQPDIIEFIEYILAGHLNYGITEYLVRIIHHHDIVNMASVR